MQSFLFDINNVTIKISSEFREYFQFLQIFFRKVILPAEGQQTADIEIDINWYGDSLRQYLKDLKTDRDYSEIGASTLIAKDTVVTMKKIEKKRKAVFHARIEEEKLKIKILFEKKPFKDFMAYGFLRKPQDEWFFALTYHLIYYPVFWYLERFRQIHPLHASAFSFKNKGVIICGLESIGKTSLSLMFLRAGDSSFLSDNIIFCDNAKVYPCYELVRIHKGDDSEVWKKHFEKIDCFHIPKDLYQPKFPLDAKGCQPHLMIFPEFHSRFHVEEISKKEAVHRAVTLSHIPSELNNYYEYRNFYNLLDVTFNPWQSLYESVGQMLNSARCYRIQMPKSDGLEKNFERVKNFLFHDKSKS